jgi:hypothetical protein
VILSAERALRGQTPDNLRAYSVAIDPTAREIVLRAHFYAPPSEQDLEDMSVAETEVDADFWNQFTNTRTEVDIAPLGTAPQFLPGGVVFNRDETTR